MNQKVQQLIDDGQLTIEDLLEYAQQYMNGVDQYDDEQIDKYYQEEYMQDCEPEHPLPSDTWDGGFVQEP